MITVSNAFKTTVKSPSRDGYSYLDVYEVFVPNNNLFPSDTLYPCNTWNTDTIEDSGNISEWEINEKVEIGKATMRSISIKVLNNYDLANKEVEVFGGVKLADNSVEYVNLGRYIISKPKTNNTGLVTVYEGYDYMLKFQQDYTTELTYPKTVLEIAQEICDNAGVELGNTDFFNYNLSITTAPDTIGLTYRDVLKWIAEVSLTICRIGYDNKLYFNELYATNETVDGNHYFDLTLEQKYGSVNSLYLQSSEYGTTISSKDDTNILTNGETSLKFIDNLLIDDVRSDVIDSMLAQIEGLEYYPFEARWMNWLYLECGDQITLNDVDDVQHSTAIFEQDIKFNGAWKGTIRTEAPTKSETDYSGNSQINKIMSRKTSNSKIISRINQSPEEIQIQADKVSLVGKTIDLTTDNIVIDSTNFSVDKDGNVNASGGNVIINDEGIKVNAGSYKIIEDDIECNILNLDNLVNDHSLEMLDVDSARDITYHDWEVLTSGNIYMWNKAIGNPKLLSTGGAGEVPQTRFNNQCIAVNSTNSIVQYIPLKPSTAYVFTGYIAKGWRSSGSSIAKVTMEYRKSDLSLISSESQIFSPNSNNFDWKRGVFQFTTPSIDFWYLSVKLEANDSNWIYWDGIQIVEGELPCLYNPETQLWKYINGLIE